MDCLFCKLVAGEIPSYKIYEDDKVLAFLDIKPFTTGHTLVIPKDHHRWVWDIPTEEIGHFYQVCKKVAQHYQKISGKEYVYSITAGEEVPHAHYHILPNIDEGFHDKMNNVGIANARLTMTSEQLQEIHKKYQISE